MSKTALLTSYVVITTYPSITQGLRFRIVLISKPAQQATHHVCGLAYQASSFQLTLSLKILPESIYIVKEARFVEPLLRREVHVLHAKLDL